MKSKSKLNYVKVKVIEEFWCCDIDNNLKKSPDPKFKYCKFCGKRYQLEWIPDPAGGPSQSEWVRIFPPVKEPKFKPDRPVIRKSL